MEIANRFMVRESRHDDAGALRQLLEQADYTHWHADWHVPHDWLGTPTFFVAENGLGELAGCLAAAADPLPAAWVRLAALRQRSYALPLLHELLRRVQPALASAGVAELAWLLPEPWPEYWLESLRFQPRTRIETYVKNDTVLPLLRPVPGLTIRPVREEDLPHLVALEREAFEPIWRHSVEGLRLGWQASLSFEVAELSGELVAFQYSARSQTERAAHLVRITVSPGLHGSGIGSALLAHTLQGYYGRGLERVSLNTQADNLPSQRLYAKFGFYRAGFSLPVWVQSI